jgi:DNA-binding GntR family transcriptional regulator
MSSPLPTTEISAETSPRPETLTGAVYAQLKEALVDFRLPPGQRYSERDLARVLGVSRTPLRFALHRLAHEGYLKNIGGHAAWQVSPLDLSFYEDLYDFRVELEVLATARLCAGCPLPELEPLTRFWCVPEPRRQLNGAKVAEQDEAFHRTLVGLSGNAAMLRTFDDLTERIRIIRRLDFASPKRVQDTYGQHAAILAAIETSDASTTERLIRRHIEQSRVEIRRITLHNMVLASSASELSITTDNSSERIN